MERRDDERLQHGRETTPSGPAVALALLAQGTAALAGPPDFSGKWRLNHERSDNVREKIEQASGPATIKGAGRDGARERWIPRNEGGEVDRVRLREYMLASVEQLEQLEIAQSATEIKIVQGDLARTFYFGREHTRQAESGEKLKVRSSWKGGQLVIDEKGEKGLRLMQVLTLLPGGNQVIQALRYESPLLPQPVEIRLVYDRASEPKG
jgi:hypothetical protein